MGVESLALKKHLNFGIFWGFWWKIRNLKRIGGRKRTFQCLCPELRWWWSDFWEVCLHEYVAKNNNGLTLTVTLMHHLLPLNMPMSPVQTAADFTLETRLNCRCGRNLFVSFPQLVTSHRQTYPSRYTGWVKHVCKFMSQCVNHVILKGMKIKTSTVVFFFRNHPLLSSKLIWS